MAFCCWRPTTVEELEEELVNLRQQSENILMALSKIDEKIAEDGIDIARFRVIKGNKNEHTIALRKLEVTIKKKDEKLRKMLEDDSNSSCCILFGRRPAETSTNIGVLTNEPPVLGVALVPVLDEDRVVVVVEEFSPEFPEVSNQDKRQPVVIQPVPITITFTEKKQEMKVLSAERQENILVEEEKDQKVVKDVTIYSHSKIHTEIKKVMIHAEVYTEGNVDDINDTGISKKDTQKLSDKSSSSTSGDESDAFLTCGSGSESNDEDEWKKIADSDNEYLSCISEEED